MTKAQSIFLMVAILGWAAGVQTVLVCQSIARWLEQQRDDEWPM